jgi:hypothetical protein
VLRRVSEDTPRDIQELNPEVPDWLVEIIGILHAKDPADRFQTAAELSRLLERCLAHLRGHLVDPEISAAGSCGLFRWGKRRRRPGRGARAETTVGDSHQWDSGKTTAAQPAVVPGPVSISARESGRGREMALGGSERRADHP